MKPVWKASHQMRIRGHTPKALRVKNKETWNVFMFPECFFNYLKPIYKDLYRTGSASYYNL